jgi:threonine-phosphate decarboxylase
MISGHGGNVYDLARSHGCPVSEIVDMSSNINSLGPPPGLLDFLKSNMEILTRLPEVDARDSIRSFADLNDIDPRRILAGNGTTQFIYSIPEVLGSKQALILGPTYSDYRDACLRHGIKPILAAATDSDHFTPKLNDLSKSISTVDTVFICNPNNPTGSLLTRENLLSICGAHPQTIFIIDESYLSFVVGGEHHSMVNAELDNVIVLASISKMFTIPGLRIGFMIGSQDRINQFEQYRLPWNVNALAQAAVGYLDRHHRQVRTFIKNTQLYFQTQKEAFYKAIEPCEQLRPLPSTTPFILIKLKGEFLSDKVCAALAAEKILIRNCSNFDGLSNRFVRVSLKSPELNRLIAGKLMALTQSPQMESVLSAKRRIA